jgi:hypothetical protein
LSQELKLLVVCGAMRPIGSSRELLEKAAETRFASTWIVLAGIFLLSFGIRLYGALIFGADLDGPGTFRMINYDEGNACEGQLGALPYPPFVGVQAIAMARILGEPPPAHFPQTAEEWQAVQREPQRNAELVGKAKAYCESRPLILIQRIYSVVTGALSVVLVGLLGLMLWPSRPQIAWTAAALLGFSNLHVAESQSATVDVPQVFFILLFTVTLSYGLVSQKRWPFIVSPILLVWAILVKWYVFAICGYACLLPWFQFRQHWKWYLVAMLCLVVVAAVLIGQQVGWQNVSQMIHDRRYLLWGDETGVFGTDYGHIGTWRRWIRNSTNLFIVHVVGLGLPPCLFVWQGIKRAVAARETHALWLAQAPAFAYALYMLVVGPVTYYRHYLPLFPTVVLLAASGFWESRWATKKVAIGLFLLYPLLLTADSQYNYRHDPRRALRQWYDAHRKPRLLVSYYVVPPPAPLGTAALFDMDQYLRAGAAYLRRADYLILSENWYDTAFANELNGPIAWDPAWLIKTKPEYAVAYRRILSNQDPNLQLDTALDVQPFMPEFLLHRFFYGSFQLFIGDLKIFRIKS